MPRVVHFEIHADDPVRAMQFYGDVLGWTFQEYFPDYWGVITGEEGTPGINGGLLRRHGPPPELGQAVNACACTVDVPNVDEYMAKAVSAGATVALPKQAIPNMGWVGYCIDTEGNIFGMYQEDPGAA